MVKAYYRFVLFSYGTQGVSDSTKPLSNWKPMEQFNNEELLSYLPIDRGWDSIKIETKIEEK